MDNYLLTGHILRCKLIPKDEVHPELWIGANRKWRAVPRDRVVRVQQNKARSSVPPSRSIIIIITYSCFSLGQENSGLKPTNG